MGGMRALEWAVAMPDRVATLFFPASGAVASADQIGTQTTQQAAIRADPRWAGGDYDPADPPVDGLGIARRIAHLTYRSAFELGERFGTVVQDDGRTPSPPTWTTTRTSWPAGSTPAATCCSPRR